MPKVHLTKTDMVILMQVLNKALARTDIGHSNKNHLPRIIQKIDNELLKLIDNEKKGQDRL